MKTTIICTLGIIVALLVSIGASAQVYDGFPGDSATIQFTGSIMHSYIADTAAIPLWQMGHSHKSFFGTDTTGATTIMTDTTSSYPINANNWFVIKVNKGFNTIVDFWHKYQTDSAHDGGIVEFSLDHGMSWQNVLGSCNIDGNILTPGGVYTSNFYAATDTLPSGEPSFSGIYNSVRYSRIQFFDAWPERTTSGAGCSMATDSFYIRFRFVSDTTADTLAGWIIDSVKVEYDLFGGGYVPTAARQMLHIFPDPSANGLFNFPALNNEQQYTLQVYNATGMQILNVPYTHVVNIGSYAKGLYFYKVTDGHEYYTGQLLTE